MYDTCCCLFCCFTGVTHLEAANWTAAADAFTATLVALEQHEAAGPARAQRQAFAAHYLAAVLLLKAAGTGAGQREAKLYRWESNNNTGVEGVGGLFFFREGSEGCCSGAAVVLQCLC